MLPLVNTYRIEHKLGANKYGTMIQFKRNFRYWERTF